MSNIKILELLKIERKCVETASGHNLNGEPVKMCDRDCANCKLVQEDMDLLEMYEEVIKTYERKVERDRWDALEREIAYDRGNGCF